jgi:pyruvate formate lyase activating enzyme
LCSISGECVKICPSGAIQFTGSVVSVSDIISEIAKDVLYYRISGGGVTLTGGEPLFQPDFSYELLKVCKQMNIHTAIETCLFGEREALDRIAEYVDLFIIDMKISDPYKHRYYTGKSNEAIRENFSYLVKTGKSVLVRIPLIRDITDTEENKNDLISFIHGINETIPVEYISYNPLTENNYKKLNIPFLVRS